MMATRTGSAKKASTKKAGALPLWCGLTRSLDDSSSNLAAVKAVVYRPKTETRLGGERPRSKAGVLNVALVMSHPLEMPEFDVTVRGGRIRGRARESATLVRAVNVQLRTTVATLAADRTKATGAIGLAGVTGRLAVREGQELGTKAGTVPKRAATIGANGIIRIRSTQAAGGLMPVSRRGERA